MASKMIQNVFHLSQCTPHSPILLLPFWPSYSSSNCPSNLPSPVLCTCWSPFQNILSPDLHITVTIFFTSFRHLQNFTFLTIPPKRILFVVSSLTLPYFFPIPHQYHLDNMCLIIDFGLPTRTGTLGVCFAHHILNAAYMKG